MSSTNFRPVKPLVRNHAGLAVKDNNAEQKLIRMVLTSMLWENQFYMDGKSNADMIKDLVPQVPAERVSALAIVARDKFKLRHVPLLLARELARSGKLSADVLDAIIQRPDEMSEFLSLYWKEGKTPISNQVKKGLAQSFGKFNEYQLAKWDKNSSAISLRDVMFLSHAKPKTSEQESLFKRVANQQLVTPDTWETQLSAGADKKATFERLMSERKLGALAFLRNLRNMVEAGVSPGYIHSYGETVDVSKVLPFRYIAAARIVPQFKHMLEGMMLRSLAEMPKLTGKTKLVIDVSGSMFGGSKVSAKSDLNRFDAAAALAMLCASVCSEVEIFTFSTSVVKVTPRKGFDLIDALSNSQQHGGTELGKALRAIGNDYDRIIVFTDEQSSDRPAAPAGKGYIVNVASYENGINHGAWTQVSGFSEAVIDYIRESELMG